MSDLELALSLAAMKMGVPAVVPGDYPFPLGRTIRVDSLDDIAQAVVGFANVRRLLNVPDRPEYPSYCDPDNAEQDIEAAIVWGDSPESFYIVRGGEVSETETIVTGRPEGAMGIITSAWMRLQNRPTFRENAALLFPDFNSASEAVRAVLQAGLYPSNIRILDSNEAWLNKVHEGTEAVMVLGFESADHTLEAWMKRALECAMDHGGVIPDEEGGDTGAHDRNKEGIAGAWRDSFIGMPYIWEALVAMGMISETYETAITWERFPEFHETVITEMNKVMNEVCGGGFISCRFTYAYPDGPAPYYSITAPGKKGSQLQMGIEIKNAISELFVKLGGTITHHHAVGRYHHKWYKKQRPELFGEVLKAAKHKLDPAGIMNPGVLVDPLR